MRDIKTKEHERKPKTRNPTSKMPKELVRTAALEAKMKSNRAVDAAVSKESQASPTEYASEKLASAEEWTAGDAASFAVRKLVRKSCEKIKERKREAETAETAVTEAAGEIAEGTAGELKKLHQPAGTQGNVGVREGRGEALPRDRLTMQRRIKVKPESK